jgi:WD40 repeat protein
LYSADGQPGSICRGHTEDVSGLAWTADGQGLISASADDTVRRWNPTSGKLEWTAVTLADQTSVTFGAGGQVLDGTPRQLAEHFVCVVERDDGQLGLLSFANLLKSVGLDADEAFAKAEATKAPPTATKKR